MTIIIKTTRATGWPDYRRHLLAMCRVTLQRRWLSIILCTVLAALNLRPAEARDGSFEYAIKATYLTKFAPFVVWPKSSEAQAQVFTICIIGDDPFGSLLDKIVQDEQINNQPIVIHRLARPSQSDECQILYTGVMTWTAELRAALNGKPILTVAEEAPTNNAIIQFLLVDGRVRFKVDAITAANSNLVVSSKLLNLATSVRRQEK